MLFTDSEVSQIQYATYDGGVNNIPLRWNLSRLEQLTESHPELKTVSSRSRVSGNSSHCMESRLPRCDSIISLSEEQEEQEYVKTDPSAKVQTPRVHAVEAIVAPPVTEKDLQKEVWSYCHTTNEPVHQIGLHGFNGDIYDGVVTMKPTEGRKKVIHAISKYSSMSPKKMTPTVNAARKLKEQTRKEDEHKKKIDSIMSVVKFRKFCERQKQIETGSMSKADIIAAKYQKQRSRTRPPSPEKQKPLIQLLKIPRH